MSVEIGNEIKAIAKGVINGMSLSDIIDATVVDVTPDGPVVQIDNNINPLPAAAVAVPDYLGSYTVTVSGAASGELTIDNSLKKGDLVYMIRRGGGQKYLVLGRVG